MAGDGEEKRDSEQYATFERPKVVGEADDQGQQDKSGERQQNYARDQANRGHSSRRRVVLLGLRSDVLGSTQPLEQREDLAPCFFDEFSSRNRDMRTHLIDHFAPTSAWDVAKMPFQVTQISVDLPITDVFHS